MKCVIWIFLLPMKYGVFGAEEMKTVTEGDYLTLQTGFSEIQSDDRILWLYGSEIIARIDKAGGIFKTNDIDDGRFKGKLELDKQTGSLIIKDIRIKNAGDYQLEKKGVTAGKFMVTVYARLSTPAIGFSECAPTPAGSSSPICVLQCSVQTVGLVTLSWYKGNNLVSTRISDTCSSTFLLLKVDYNDKNTYSCMVNNPISNRTQHLHISGLCHKCTAVPDSGVSPAAVAGIVIGVLLVAAAAAAAGVIYYRRKISEQKQLLWVTEGDNVTLNPDTEIQTADEIQWLFGAEGTLIAESKAETRKIITHEGPDEIFRIRLKLDRKTGSLTIMNTTTEHTGSYTLKIRRGRKTFYTRFYVSVSVLTPEKRTISVKKGDPVTLEPAIGINKDNLIQWQFVDEEQQTVIAEIKGETGEIFTYDYVADGGFRNRLELDKTTGSLTIKNTRTVHSGLYILQIISSSGVSDQTFFVTVNDKVEEKLLKGEDFVTLNPDPKIQRDDQILWMFGNQKNLIAQMKGGTVEIYDDANQRFRGRLKLNKTTGSLTITNIEAKHTGLYKLLTISSSGGYLYKKFRVLIQMRYEEGRKGEPVRLYTGLTKIQSDDEIQWMFGDENSLIAKIKGGIGKTYDGPDGRFRDSLELNETGDLIIRNSTAEHAGHYKLKIRSSKGNTNWTFIAIIRDSTGKRVNESATVEMERLLME